MYIRQCTAFYMISLIFLNPIIQGNFFEIKYFETTYWNATLYIWEYQPRRTNTETYSNKITKP